MFSGDTIVHAQLRKFFGGFAQTRGSRDMNRSLAPPRTLAGTFPVAAILMA